MEKVCMVGLGCSILYTLQLITCYEQLPTIVGWAVLQNCWTDWDAFWGLNSGGPKAPHTTSLCHITCLAYCYTCHTFSGLCVSLCWDSPMSPAKRLTDWFRCHLEADSVGRRNHVLDGGCTLAPHGEYGEWFVHNGDAALCQITFTTG